MASSIVRQWGKEGREQSGVTGRSGPASAVMGGGLYYGEEREDEQEQNQKATRDKLFNKIKEIV